jgi:hypothetical protein
MPSFLIHVGPHKTGTTYLQLSMKAARDEMRARGIFMPEIWEHAPGNPSHSKLAVALREGQIRPIAAQFAAFPADAETILISAEDLSNLDVPALLALRTLIGDNPVRIVFYLRRWTELVPSSWQESTKHGQTSTLPEFVLGHVQRPMASRLLNFDLKISAMIEAFGAAHVSLVSYSELRDQKFDLFQHFMHSFLDWDTEPPLPEMQKANASRDPRETELLRALHAMAKHRGGTKPEHVRRVFDRNRTAPDVIALLASMKPWLTSLRFNDDWPALKKVHIEMVTKHQRMIVPPKQPGQIFRGSIADLRYVGPDWVLRSGAGHDMENLLDRLLQHEFV